MPNIRLGKVSISPQGEFTSGTEYERLDLVYSPEQRSSYLCIQTNTGEPLNNPDFWVLVAHGSGAYEAAVKGGYTDTEEAFNQELSQFVTYSEQAQAAAIEAATQAGKAQVSADTAKTEADRAKTEADRAEAAAGFNPDDYVKSTFQLNGYALNGTQLDLAAADVGAATPSDIEALSTRVDNMEASGGSGGVPVKTVVTQLDESAVSVTSGNATVVHASIEIYKTGNVVTVAGVIQGSISNDVLGKFVFTSPYKPMNNSAFSVSRIYVPSATESVGAQGYINTSGQVEITCVSTGTNMAGGYFNFTYYDGEDFGAGVLEAAGKEVRPVVKTVIATTIETGTTITSQNIKYIKTGNIVTCVGSLGYDKNPTGSWSNFTVKNVPLPAENGVFNAISGGTDEIPTKKSTISVNQNGWNIHPEFSKAVSSSYINFAFTYQTAEPFGLSVVEPDLAPIRTQLNELKEKVDKVSKPDYAGTLKVIVTTDDSGSWGNTRVRVTNNLFGQKFYPLDALGQLTLQLLANQTYTVRLVDIPEKYYSQIQMVDIKSQETATLNFTLSTKPDVVGYRIKKATGEVEYIEGAAGMEPARMDFTANKNHPGDWGDHWLFRNIRPCLLKDGEVQYYLNPNDYTKKSDGLDVEITKVSENIMVEFPLVYTKEYEDDTYNYCLMCSENWDGSFHASAFTNQNGAVQETMYIGAYEGSDTLAGTWRVGSRSGAQPSSNYAIGEYRTRATNHGPGQQQLEWSKHSLLQNLFVMKYKGLNSQALLGKGNTSSSAALPTGTMNQKGMDWGDQTGTNGVKFCGIEHPWGNLWKFCDGLGVKESGEIAYSVRAPYNDTLSGYLSSGVVSTQFGKTSGSISKMRSGGFGKIPAALDGTANTFYGDQCYFGSNAGTYSCVTGGVYGIGGSAGLFSTNFSSPITNKSNTIGARLCYTPQ